jgi:hypothetical protein
MKKKKKIIIRAGTLLINHKKLKTFFLYLMKSLKSNHFPIRKILQASRLKSNKRRVLTSLTMMSDPHPDNLTTITLSITF